MPYKSDYTSNRSSNVYGKFVPMPMNVKRDMSLYENVIGKLNDQQDKTNEVLNRVTTAFQNAKLHHSEDEYKKNRIDYYTNEIRKNPFDFVRAEQLAAQAANDTEFITKIRTNQEYEDFRSHVEDYRNKGQIDDITAERLLNEESNQYKYTPTYDDMGRIVGSSRWTAGKMPVKKVDRVQMAALAAQLAKPYKGSNRSQTASDVTNADGTGSGSSSMSGRQYERLSKEKIQEVFDGVFAAMPGAQDALMQDYEDDLYRIEKANKELQTTLDPGARHKLQAEIDMTSERLYDKGVLRSPQSYMAYSMGLIVPNMAYDWEFTESASTSRRDNEQSASAGGAGNGLLNGMNQVANMLSRFTEGSAEGGTVHYSATDYIGNLMGAQKVYDTIVSLLTGSTYTSKNTGQTFNIN